MDRDIDDEIASYLAEATDEYIQQGLAPEDARRAARRSFGGVTQAGEIHRQVRSFMWLEAVQASEIETVASRQEDHHADVDRAVAGVIDRRG